MSRSFSRSTYLQNCRPHCWTASREKRSWEYGIRSSAVHPPPSTCVAASHTGSHESSPLNDSPRTPAGLISNSAWSRWLWYGSSTTMSLSDVSELKAPLLPLPSSSWSRARRDQLLDGNGNNGAFNSLTSDKLIVVLDPYHNHLDQALFEINPAGVRGESFNGDDSWDPVWEAATQVDGGGWTAELRIPYSQLRFSREAVQQWGLQFWRYVDRLNERDMWSFRRQNENGGPAFYGHLDGLTIARQPRQVEVVPYAVARAQSKPSVAGDPYHSGSERKLNVGGDLKYLLTTNLTLDATVNPDFGQVEVDPSVLNLSASE